MTSVRIAIYASIVLHFLRMTARKLSPDRPRETRGNAHGEPPGRPVQVGVGIIRVATCIDRETASALANTLNGMKSGYGLRFSLLDPDEEINGYKLEVLKSDKIHLLRDNFRNCPNPCLLAKIMQEAAIYVILHSIYTYR